MANKKNKNAVPKQAPQPNRPAPQVKAAASKTAVAGKSMSLTLKLAILLGIISFLVYANTLKNGYVLDDSSAIFENTIVQKGTSGIGELLSTPYRRGFYITENDLYRPLSLVTLAIEYQFFGLNPMPNHFVNILVFAGCVILLFFFLDQFFERKKTAVAFIAALLFALHPIHTEVVANVKSRDELLCFFFAFLSLNVFMKYMQSGKILQLLLGAFCFFLSFLSKETVITFLAVIPLVFFFYNNENRKRAILITVSAVAVAIIVLLIRMSVLEAYNANHAASIDIVDNSLAAKYLSIESRLATAIFILGKYLKLLLIPYPLISDYTFDSIPFVHFSNPLVLLSLAVYLFLGVFGLIRLFKNKKDPYAFIILFYLITMSLFSNIPFLIGATMGERFLFFGSISFCLVVSLLIEKLAGKAAETDLTFLKDVKVLGIIIPVGLIFAIITFNRNSEWVDNYTLYKNDVVKNPNAGKLNYFLGLELEKVVAPAEKNPAKQVEIRKEGLMYLQRAMAIDTGFGEGHSNLGHAYFVVAKYDSAKYHLEKALRMLPTNLMTIDNLADVYYFTKEYRQSIDLSKRAITLKPDDITPYTNLGRSYLALGRLDSVVYYINTAIKLNPNNSFSYIVLAHTYKAANMVDSMRKYEALAQKFDPNFKLN